MTKPVILAPAGTREAVTAAVRCGADAVYLGAKHFNARRNAENFDDTALPETVRFCHERGTKVFVTVNTLLTDAELPLLEEEAALVCASGADAVIIQDPAVMRHFREKYPTMERHASTQTVVHDLDGAKYLEDLGYETIVLARELTLREMEHICSHISARAEAFVHGAHCMSVSGACYLSAMLGGRSGNRGLCAQPCRLDWQCAGHGYALSLKDMSLLHHVREMADAGIGTFKIEGRMKRPEYVAAVTAACRKALAGEPFDEDELRAVFSRSGFTDGYLMGRRGAEMYGYRTHGDVTGAEKVLGGLARLYDNETPRVGVSMAFSMEDGGSALTVSDGERTVTGKGAVPESARNRPLDEDGAKKNLSKTGGTPFFVTDFSAELAPGLVMSAASLNALRRDALAELLALRGEPRQYEERPYRPEPPEKRPSREPTLWARFSEPAQITNAEDFGKILLPMHTVTPELIAQYGEKLVCELPAVCWPDDEAGCEAVLRELVRAGLREVWGENIYSIPLARRVGVTLRGGAGLNILNTEAVRHYEEEGLASLTASFELSMAKIRSLGGKKPLGIVGYGRLPLMRFRNCPLRAAEGCGACRWHGELTDRKNIRFPVECTEKRYSTLLNSVPLHIAERDMRGLDFCLLYFTCETPGECAAVTEEYKAHAKCAGERTGGLYYRELL